MNVVLKELHPKNFRCFDDRTFRFGHNTVIRGTNGTGKSTLFDAFLFTLFGKDSRGRSNFGYKRRDASGAIIHELEYGCEVVLDVDGVEKRFERVVTEKYSEESLVGNVCAYYADRVRCATKKEYDEAVAGIMSEDVFRIMTDVNYFMAQRDDYKKSILMRIAFGSSDSNEVDRLVVSEVLEAYPDLRDFVAELNGTDVKEYNRRVREQINTIKSELGDIFTKIAAKKEAMPPAEDWDALQDLIEANKDQLDEVVKQMDDESSRKAAYTEKRNSLRVELSNKQIELLRIESEIRADVTNSESDKRKALSDADNEYSEKLNEYNRLSRSLDEKRQDMREIVAKYDAQIAVDNSKIAELNDKAARMRETYKAIKNDTYQYTADELECPTCHRPYDRNKLKEQKLSENVSIGKHIMNVEIAQLRDEVTLLEHKKQSEVDAINKEIEDLEEEKRQCRASVDALYQRKESLAYTPADVEKLIRSDEACQTIREEMEKLRLQIDKAKAPEQPSSLLAEKQEMEGKIQSLQAKLGVRDTITRIEAQVAELEAKTTALNNELGELETKQSVALRFQKAKDNQLLSRINKKFRLVSWDFVSEQYNGNDKIACNCYVEGIPYAERNHAGQVNAGLDIINALAQCEGVHLPIFIDNAESVVDYIPTECQKILLTVDPSCSELKFEM